MSKTNISSLYFLFLLCIISVSVGVKRSDFKTCEQSSFCKRNRFADTEQVTYSVLPDTLVYRWNGLHSHVQNQDGSVFTLNLTMFEGGIARLLIDEKGREWPRHHLSDVVLLDDLKEASSVVEKWDEDSTELRFDENCLAVVRHSPLAIKVTCADETVFVFNRHGFLNFETYREKKVMEEVEAPQEEEEEEIHDDAHEGDEGKKEEQENDAKNIKDKEDADAKDAEPEGFWEENFASHRDTKPHGGSAVSFDVVFPFASNVFGIPEHATSFSLKYSRNSKNEAITDPYRLYNLDVFEYELDNPMALYGSIPFMTAHGKGTSSGKPVTVGIFWNNASEMWVDVEETDKNRKGVGSRWIAESGVLDVFFFVGPTPAKVLDQYTKTTGRPQMPQRFATMYHQCRWNYRSQEDLLEVYNKFDSLDIPVDVLWLDIEHTDAKKYFTWDGYNFPDSIEMLNELNKTSRKLVTIIDPHIKKDNNYFVDKELNDKGFYVRDKDNNVYEGSCWPGQSHYVDFFMPEARNWWADLMSFDRYVGSAANLYTWNDMQEPSVFSGPEITMHKDALHSGGSIEHRDVHNAYAFMFGLASHQGLIDRHPGKNDRPFILSRGHFAGSQRYTSVWTGDNTAEWGHLRATIPMCLSSSVAGLSFVGADVGGFFGNPDAELFTRWYQAAAFQPFFRGHAHIDTNRREPWSFDSDTTIRVREAIRARYSYLSYIYTLFAESNETGAPIMRPFFYEFPDQTFLFGEEKEFLLGNALLIAPVVDEGSNDRPIVFPPGVWYDVSVRTSDSQASLLQYARRTFIGPHEEKRYPASIDTIPVFQRGGTIIPRNLRVRRSASVMEHDPLTLEIALDGENSAQGRLYLDDGKSFNYEKGGYIDVLFKFDKNVLDMSVRMKEWSKKKYETSAHIERIVVRWFKPSSSLVKDVVLDDGRSLDFEMFENGRVLVVRNPKIAISSSVRMTLTT